MSFFAYLCHLFGIREKAKIVYKLLCDNNENVLSRLNTFPLEIKENFSLKMYNTFGIDAKAKHLP